VCHFYLYDIFLCHVSLVWSLCISCLVLYLSYYIALIFIYIMFLYAFLYCSSLFIFHVLLVLSMCVICFKGFVSTCFMFQFSVLSMCHVSLLRSLYVSFFPFWLLYVYCFLIWSLYVSCVTSLLFICVIFNFSGLSMYIV